VPHSTGRSSTEDWILKAGRRLQRARLFFGHGAQNAYDEAAWMLAHTCRISPSRYDELSMHDLDEAERECADALIAERIRTRVPAAYLLHEAWLSGRRFYVDERVIVPRSFIAELLEEKFSPWIERPAKVARVLDMCTGSGCLAILAAQAFRGAKVDAVDLSADALAVAAVNVRRHRLSRRLRLIESDVFSKVPRGRYDLIITNPPYVDAASMRTLPDEFRHEPKLALAGGSNGLVLVKRIMAEAPKFLTPGGLLVMEIGHNRAVLEKAYPRTAFTWLDTSGGDEFVCLLTREQALEATRSKG
jgi:ribosomal protein L3 glutamine methyltransferase